MTKWSFSMINRHEYERVCAENRELKAELEKITQQLFVMYVTYIKKLGGNIDSVGAVERVGESREQADD
jgi:hypothetical protein